MIWQSPWAWLGLVTVALPVLIHLLGQGPARRQLFPTLRFFGTARPLPTRRTRLHDLLLLLLRIGIIAAAVAALAQPLVLTGARRDAVDKTLVRAIIIDTSASMARFTPAGERAVIAAMHRAAQVGDSAQQHIMLLADAPSRAIPGAVAWLSRQTGRAELDVLSDFQSGVIEPRDIAGIPSNIGVRFGRIAIRDSAAPITTLSRQGDVEIVARTTLLPQSTVVDWQPLGTAPSAARQADLVALTGADDAAGATAAAQAARAIGAALPLDTTHAIAIVYPHAAERTGVLQRGTPPRMPWMADLVATLRGDPALAAAAARAAIADTTALPAQLTVARSSTGQPVVIAVEASILGRDRLVLLPLTEAGSLTTAALIAATTRALSNAPAPGELDPAVISDSALNAWQRLPSAAGHLADDQNDRRSDGHWLWWLVLVLLAMETLVRRTPRSATGSDTARHAAA